MIDTAAPSRGSAREDLLALQASFGVATVVAVASATVTLRSSGASTAWAGGLVVAAVLFWRCADSYRSLLARGAGLPPAVLALAAAVLVVVLVLAALAVTSLVQARRAEPGADDPRADQVGSCWQPSGSQARHVTCSSERARWQADRRVVDPAECAAPYVPASAGEVLCLSPVRR